MTQMHVVLMGVAGSGKTSVLHEVHRKIGWSLAEGDAFHPEANVAKMASGTPLVDEDRWPWLDRVVTWTSVEDAAGRNTLITCSALKRGYRDRLRQAPGHTVFVHLVGTPGQLAQRIAARTDHFMPPSLLPSQLAALEPLGEDEEGILVDITPPVGEIADEIIARLDLAPVHYRPAADR